MVEIFLQCQYGERRKDGRIVRPASCMNRASGVFRVYLVRGKPKAMMLCAQCGFTKLVGRVKCAIKPSTDEIVYFHDVARVELLATFDTEFDQLDVPRAVGYKHWVERKDEMVERPSRFRLKVIPPRAAHMDMSKYLETLRRHDDGR